jgi:hypothetical protein
MTSRTAPITEQTSNRAIAGVVRRIGTAGKAFNETVQEGAMMVLSHVAQFRDCTGAARIIDAMPKTTRRSLLQKWFATHGGIIITSKDGKVNASLAKDGNKNYKLSPDIEAARANPWYEVPESEKGNADLYTLEDFNESVNRMIVRVQNMIDRTEKNANDGQRVNGGDLERLKAQVKALQAVVKGDTNDNTNEPAARQTA